MPLVTITFIAFLLLGALWTLMSLLTILLLLRYEGLSLATWIAIALYSIATGSILLFVGVHVASVGLDAILPELFSAY